MNFMRNWINLKETQKIFFTVNDNFEEKYWDFNVIRAGLIKNNPTSYYAQQSLKYWLIWYVKLEKKHSMNKH
jgi:hypothetical protein